MFYKLCKKIALCRNNKRRISIAEETHARETPTRLPFRKGITVSRVTVFIGVTSVFTPYTENCLHMCVCVLDLGVQKGMSKHRTRGESKSRTTTSSSTKSCKYTQWQDYTTNFKFPEFSNWDKDKFEKYALILATLEFFQSHPLKTIMLKKNCAQNLKSIGYH